jgi:hypothetical protein
MREAADYHEAILQNARKGFAPAGRVSAVDSNAMAKGSKLQLKIASPCPTSWNDMDGDERVRFYQREDGTVITRDCPVGMEEREGVVAVGGLEPPPFLED